MDGEKSPTIFVPANSSPVNIVVSSKVQNGYPEEPERCIKSVPTQRINTLEKRIWSMLPSSAYLKCAMDDMTNKLVDENNAYPLSSSNITDLSRDTINSKEGVCYTPINL